MSPLRGNEDTKGTGDYDYLVAAGDAAGLIDTGELLVAGVEFDCCAGLAAGLDAGCDPVEPAGRRPRLLGLFNMLVARLLMIFASLSAVSNNAALRICLRWFVRP